jgi:hypothetical protein
VGLAPAHRGDAWGRRPEPLIGDGRPVFDERLPRPGKALGIDARLAPVRTQGANSVAGRAVGAVRGGWWDHLLPADGRQPRTVAAQRLDRLNTARPHWTLRLEVPLSTTRSPTGSVHVLPVLGGLHHSCRGPREPG